MNRNIYNSAIFIFASLLNGDQSLTLLHLERPKLCRVLAVLNAIGLKKRIYFSKIQKFYVSPKVVNQDS